MIFRASIPEIRESLVEPFQVYPIARFGTVHVYAYRSFGEVTRHRHPEFDEVFLVYEGLVTFWTDRQEVTLKPDELIRIPRGMAHRSGSRGFRGRAGIGSPDQDPVLGRCMLPRKT